METGTLEIPHFTRVYLNQQIVYPDANAGGRVGGGIIDIGKKDLRYYTAGGYIKVMKSWLS